MTTSSKKAEGSPSSDPKAPWWLLWIGAVLAAIVVILVSLDRIQDYACRHGISSACPGHFTLVLGIWPPDTAAGWMGSISNPTTYTGSITDARLVFKREKPNLPVAFTLSYAPSTWQASAICGQPDPVIPNVQLLPQAATEFRLMLYAGGLRHSNQVNMGGIDKLLPERLSLSCEVQVDIVLGDGQKRNVAYEFACSRLPSPPCH